MSDLRRGNCGRHPIEARSRINFCDGPCKSWLHRQCAGLTKKAFQSISLPDKFYCPMCRLTNNESELEKLRVRVADFEAKLSTLLPAEESANSSAWADAIKSSGTNKACPSSSAPNTGDTSEPTVNHKSKDSSSQRRFNLVVFGLEESGKGTPKFQRNRHDIEIAGELLSWLDLIVTTSLIVESFRLGRYSEKARPLLVKLTRPNDVQTILMARKKLDSRPEIAIKPDMSVEDRKVESLLLKEHRLLIDHGTDRSDIRISGNSIFVKKRRHGVIKEGAFLMCPFFTAQLGDESSSHQLPLLMSSPNKSATPITLDASASLNNPGSPEFTATL